MKGSTIFLNIVKLLNSALFIIQNLFILLSKEELINETDTDIYLIYLSEI
jgi:hypothetical protein